MRSRLKSFCTVLFLVALSLLFAGCWDRVEINEQFFILTIGIDQPRGDEASDPPREAGGDAHNRPPRFLMSTESVLVRALGQQDGAGSSIPPPVDKPARVLASTGRTLYAIERELALRVNREPFWGHVKTIVIGEAFASETGLYPIMDFFARDPQFNRRMRVGITEGVALDILQATIIPDQFVGTHISGILTKHPRVDRAPTGEFNDLDRRMNGSGHALLPRFNLGEGEVKVAGSAIIKHGKLIGWLGEMDSQWALFILDDMIDGLILVPDPISPGEEIAFAVGSSKTSIRLIQADGKIVFRISIRTEGSVAERLDFVRHIDPAVAERIETEVEGAIKKGVTHVIHELQHLYRVDVFEFWDLLHKHRPTMWEKVKEDWDEVGFPAMDFDVDVEVKIRRRGTTR